MQPLPPGFERPVHVPPPRRPLLDSRPRVIDGTEAMRPDAWLARQRELCGAGQL